jgi:polysaccharide export outer membrane protein
MSFHHPFSVKKHWSSFLVLLSCGAGLLCGCATQGPAPPKPLQEIKTPQDKKIPIVPMEIITKEMRAQREIEALNDKLFSSVSSTPGAEDYAVCEGDLLQVTVFNADELKKEARVSAGGSVTLPLLGPVEVKGLTTRQVEERIEALYGKTYLENPRVDVFIKEHQGGKISLLGAVEKPGTYDYLARRRLLDVLALAGGLTDKSARIAQVRRPSSSPQVPPGTFIVDLDELLVRGRAELNIEILAGDVIFAPAAGVVFVDGAVRNPGNLQLQPGMTIQEAITGAGGFSKTADENNIKLVRYTDEGKREVVQIKFRDLGEQGSGPVHLKDRDLVFVETNKLQTLLYSIRFNLGNGLIGVGYAPPP